MTKAKTKASTVKKQSAKAPAKPKAAPKKAAAKIAAPEVRTVQKLVIDFELMKWAKRVDVGQWRIEATGARVDIHRDKAQGGFVAKVFADDVERASAFAKSYYSSVRRAVAAFNEVQCQ